MFDIATLETGLTVGELAGLISGVISTLHTLIPLTFAIVLLGLIHNGQHNAATWSSISNQLQGTFWPFLLRADGAAAGNVRWRVQFLSGVVTFGVICLTVAGFLTPKPLSEHTRPSRHSHPAPFQYVRDTSFYGQGTLERPDAPVRRLCGWTKWADCPDSVYDDPAIRNKYVNHTVVNTSIPLQTYLPFTNTTRGNTIAGPLELGYRNYYQRADQYVDNGDVDIVGSVQPLQSFLLDDQYRVIEGLIVDTMNGGIGFRNHSLPIELQLGADWTEDILWVTPETACTSVNFSLHFSISKDNFYTTNNGYMRDDGGFANLENEIPIPRWNGPDDEWQNVFGASPDLQQRSHTLAWWNNQFTAKALNISSSSVGERFEEGLSNYAQLASPTSVTVSDMNGWYLNSVYYNDTEITKKFTAYGRRCAGFDETNPSNATKPYVRCGYLYGVPFPSQESEGQLYRYDLSSNWTQQLYTCASAMKASVKTVTFSSNATNSSATLNDLLVRAVRPKDYSHDALPVWAVEKADGYDIQDINLFWGLIDERFENSAGLETKRASELYLPAATHQTTFGHLQDSFAAGIAFAASWNSVYAFAAAIRGVAIDFIPSYSGENNYGLTLKYRDLSKTPEGAAKILNLIWTDLASFVTVGTKTGFESDRPLNLRERDAQAAILGYRNVHRRIRIIEYKDIRYAIPAFIAGGLFIFGLIPAILLSCFGVVTSRTLNHYVNHTSMGRAVVQAADPIAAPVNAKTKEWSRSAGKTMLLVPGVQVIPDEVGVAQGNGLLQRHRGRRGSRAGSSVNYTEMASIGSRGGSPGYAPVSRGSFEDQSDGSHGRVDYGIQGVSSAYLSPTTVPNSFL